MKDAIQALEAERDRAANQALAAIQRLKASLDTAAESISDAAAGKPAAPSYFIPSAQYLKEVVEYASAFAALWQAAGFFEEGAR